MPDLLLFNARIHTPNPQYPRATALAIRDGKILAMGNDEAIQRLANSDTDALNLNGHTVLPGLIDAHLHFEWYALTLQALNVETTSLEACLRRVAAKTKTTPKGQWITGVGWNHLTWGSFPTARNLDSVAPEHPVFLSAKSGHVAWTNSLALKLAEINARTVDPPGGAIQRNERGEPTGIFLEHAARLVERAIPEQTPAEVASAMLPAMENAWRMGLTGIHDFDGSRCFSAFQILKERGQLGLRVVKQIQVKHLAEAIGVGLRSGFGDDWLRVGHVKVFLDGALGPRTASMIEPYKGEPSNYGINMTDKEELYEQASRAATHGLAMTVHAIGDKANHDLLDVYEMLRGEENGRGQTPLRHRCEHVQLLHPRDFNRLGELKLIASMQPSHATSDMLMAERYWGKRSVGAYAWRTQLDAGATLAFGSDCPVESFNPFWGIHAAVTRRRADGSPSPEGWHPEQRLTVEAAVQGFTLGAAYAGYMENKIGSLAPGKLADLVVIDRDIFTCDPMAIKDTQVLGTMIEGEWKFRDE